MTVEVVERENNRNVMAVEGGGGGGARDTERETIKV